MGQFGSQIVTIYESKHTSQQAPAYPGPMLMAVHNGLKYKYYII